MYLLYYCITLLSYFILSLYHQKTPIQIKNSLFYSKKLLICRILNNERTIASANQEQNSFYLQKRTQSSLCSVYGLQKSYQNYNSQGKPLVSIVSIRKARMYLKVTESNFLFDVILEKLS